jgi:serine phosphatase RsbU (regulator of sigma subunit)
MTEVQVPAPPLQPALRRRWPAIDRAFRSASTTSEVYEVVLDMSTQVVGASAASVALLDETGEWIEVVAHTGYADDVMARFNRFQADADIPLAEAVRTERVLFLGDQAELMARYSVVAEAAETSRRAAIACLPVRVDGNVVGAIGLSFDEPVEQDDDLRTLFDVLADRCGRAMDRTVAFTPEGARFRMMMEAARGRLAFVSAATRELSRSLERDDVVQTLTELVVPRFADWASILLPEGDELVAATLVHRDAAHGDLRSRAGRFRCPIAAPTPSAEVYRTGEPQVAPGVDDDVRSRMAAYPELAPQLATTTERMVVPITARGRTLGVLTLAVGERPDFDDDDLAVALELASRAGTALDNAERFTAERDMAELLQRAVLPAALPKRSDVRLTARYLPASETAQVGGDWYDAFELRDGRIGLCVGDVVGHGLASAACMGQLRNALRVYALDGAAPGQVVEQLNRFTIDTAVTNFTTLLYGVFEPDTGRLEWTSAGHPPMVVRRSDELEVPSGGHGMPIGIVDHEYSCSVTKLEAGDMAVIYTDGLIERRTESLSNGLQRLEEAIGRHHDASLDELVDAVLAEVAPAQRADDVCILALEHIAA